MGIEQLRAWTLGPSALVILTIAGPLPLLAETTAPISVPQQSMATAIEELSHQTGVAVVVMGKNVEGKTSQAVHGSMSARQALTYLLNDPELVVQETSVGSLVVTRNTGSGLVSQDALGEDFELPPIVVRGELLERDLQENQTSVVVVTGDELEERGESDLIQTLQRVPGINTSQGIAIRGITQTAGLGSNTTSSTISVTTDGIRLTDFRNINPTDISTWDVEQVEIFRGSQSTQTGRNALAGAIVVEGTKPRFFQEYRFRLGVTETEDFEGADPGYLASFVLNTPLVEDQLAFRLSVDKRETDGFNDEQTIRAGLLYEPTDRLSLGLTYTDIDNGIDGAVEIQSPRLTADYQINDNLLLSWRGQYTDAFVEFESGFGFGRERDYETIDQELRLIYETDGLRAVGGFFYTDIDELSLLFSLPGAPSPLTGALDEDIEKENYAVYGEVEYDISPTWTVIAGLRYDVEEVDNTQTLNGLLFGSIPVTGGGTLDTTYSALLPKLGLVYSFDERRSLGVTYQRGYRAGGIGVAVPLTGGPATTFEFDPEFTDTLELSYRSQSSDARRIFNANVFYTNWTDQQVQSLSAAGLPVVTNSADSDLWGAELDFRQLVNENLDVFASAAFLNTEYGDATDIVGGDLSGNSFALAPELTASFGANYRFDNSLSVGADFNYTSSTFTDPANSAEFKNDAYWLTNINASYEFQNGFVLAAYARNLFDEDYTTLQNANIIETGPRREYGISIIADF